MYKSHVINHFGSSVKVAEVLKISRPSVCQWGDVIPEKQALKLEKLTDGSLKYDPALYKKAA